MRCLLRFVFSSSPSLALFLPLSAQQPGEADQPAEQAPPSSAPTAVGSIARQASAGRGSFMDNAIK
jgi:hypothetical protein